MNKLILSTEYFGPISSYFVINNSSKVYVEVFENYQKKSYRNRCRILTPNGINVLSVPLKSGKNNRCLITEVEISYDDDWMTEHGKSLLAAYGKSPYYEYLIDEIMSILNTKFTWLIDLNSAIQNYVIDLLEIDTSISSTREYCNEYDENYFDLREYHYLNRSKLNLPSKPYQQVWTDRNGWLEDMSILDLIFCKGKEAILYLEP